MDNREKEMRARQNWGSIVSSSCKISLLRTAKGLSQDQFAKQIGLAKSTVARAEAGKRVAPETIIAIADAVEVEPRKLLTPQATIADQYYSTFISYGGPDEDFAREVYERLDDANVRTFFFAESAKVGERLHRTMSQGIEEYDRVLLICSEASLNRPGVLNEIEQVLAREASEGGEELLLPLTLDDYLYERWQPKRYDLARQVRNRVVADFTSAKKHGPTFVLHMERIVTALRRPK